MSTHITLEIFAAELHAALVDSGRDSTAHSYKSSVKRFILFAGNKDFTFKEFTPSLLKKYEQHLYAEGCKSNTVSLYMRMLRTICNQAKELKGAKIPSNLFADVFTGSEECRKRAVAPGIIQKLYAFDLAGESSRLFLSRDMFLLSFYLRGIPFVDLAHLRKSDICRNLLTYRRSKTGRQLTVSLEPCALAIFQKYAFEVKRSPYLLPIITRPGEDEYKQYQSALRLYNLHLHRLSGLLKLKENLTSYVARHSWATAAYHKGIPVSVISESLGHASEKVTYHYLGSFDNRTLKSANRKVIALILPSYPKLKTMRRKGAPFSKIREKRKYSRPAF
jgi:integrase